MMQLEVDSTIIQNYKMYANEEVTLTNYVTLGRQPQRQIFQTPIAVFKTFPPIMLRVNFKTQENLELTSMAKNETKYMGGYTIRGKTVISNVI